MQPSHLHQKELPVVFELPPLWAVYLISEQKINYSALSSPQPRFASRIGYIVVYFVVRIDSTGRTTQPDRTIRITNLPKLTIIAHITAVTDKTELVKSELQKLIPTTLAEDGCIQYDLHQDNEDPTKFVFFENWESRDLWQDHMNAPHLASHKKATEGAIAKVTIQEMTQII